MPSRLSSLPTIATLTCFDDNAIVPYELFSSGCSAPTPLLDLRQLEPSHGCHRKRVGVMKRRPLPLDDPLPIGQRPRVFQTGRRPCGDIVRWHACALLAEGEDFDIGSVSPAVQMIR